MLHVVIAILMIRLPITATPEMVTGDVTSSMVPLETRFTAGLGCVVWEVCGVLWRGVRTLRMSGLLQRDNRANSHEDSMMSTLRALPIRHPIFLES